ELSPLEIGMHALKAVPVAEGGRGKRGAMGEYAERLGRDQSGLSQLRAAAGVAQTLETSHRIKVADRAYHLYEISKAPREAWPTLVAALVDHEWTVAEVASIVKQLREFNIPSEWQSWLQPAAVMRRFLADNRFDAG